MLKNDSDKRERYQRDSENLECRKKSAKVSKVRTAECGGQFFAHKIFGNFFGPTLAHDIPTLGNSYNVGIDFNTKLTYSSF